MKVLTVCTQVYDNGGTEGHSPNINGIYPVTVSEENGCYAMDC